MNGEVENNNERKKQIRLLVVGVVALLLLTLGATYAYFMISTSNTESKSKVDVNIDDVDSIALKGETSDLHINLSAADMAKANQNTEYFGDDAEENNYVKTLEEGIHNLGKLTATGGNGKTKYMCTANAVITMQVASESDMGKHFQPGDAYLYLNAGTLQQKIDLSELLPSGTKTIPFNIAIQSNGERLIDGYVEIINTDVDQSYLADKTLNIDISFQDLNCEIGTSKVETYLRSKDTDNKLTNTLVNGMYRYQGNSIITLETEIPPLSRDNREYKIEFLANKLTNNYKLTPIALGYSDSKDTVTNNYICLGADCNEDGTDLYRIIGITEDGLIKVIKNTPANYSIAWNSDYESDIKWPESELYQYLNSEFYNALSIDLKGMIVEPEWKYGDINNYYSIEYQNIFTPEELEKYNTLYEKIDGDGTDEEKRTAIKELSKLESEAMVKTEEKATNKTIGKVSLMSITDYCSSFESGKDLNCMTSNYYSYLSERTEADFGKTWLGPTNDWDWDWTMSRIRFNNSINSAWSVIANGSTFSGDMDRGVAARPVFYLAFDVEFSGSGTIENPFRTGIE